EVATAVYMKFRDDVITAQPTGQFRLSTRDVRRWMDENRELIEREALEQPSHAVTDADVEPKDRFTANDLSATASAAVSAFEAAWADIQRHHPELPEVVIVLGSGVERGRLVKLGHWWGGRWLAGGEVRGEVLLAGEALHLP